MKLRRTAQLRDLQVRSDLRSGATETMSSAVAASAWESLQRKARRWEQKILQLRAAGKRSSAA